MIRWQPRKTRQPSQRTLLDLCADVAGYGLIFAALMLAREILTVTGA